MILSDRDLAKHVIEAGTSLLDLGPRVAGGEEASSAAPLELHQHWPAGLKPSPIALPGNPTPFDALPKADYLVVTWTVAELEALAAVFTPGVSRNQWYRYARGFEKKYLPFIREGAPARTTRRLGSYYLTKIGDASVLCFKSELHLNQDGIMQPQGYATLPVKDLFKQMIAEVQPKLVITVGTAGATYPDHQPTASRSSRRRPTTTRPTRPTSLSRPAPSARRVSCYACKTTIWSSPRSARPPVITRTTRRRCPASGTGLRFASTEVGRRRTCPRTSQF